MRNCFNMLFIQRSRDRKPRKNKKNIEIVTFCTLPVIPARDSFEIHYNYDRPFIETSLGFIAQWLLVELHNVWPVRRISLAAYLFGQDSVLTENNIPHKRMPDWQYLNCKFYLKFAFRILRIRKNAGQHAILTAGDKSCRKLRKLLFLPVSVCFNC